MAVYYRTDMLCVHIQMPALTNETKRILITAMEISHINSNPRKSFPRLNRTQNHNYLSHNLPTRRHSSLKPLLQHLQIPRIKDRIIGTMSHNHIAGQVSFHRFSNILIRTNSPAVLSQSAHKETTGRAQRIVLAIRGSPGQRHR